MNLIPAVFRRNAAPEVDLREVLQQTEHQYDETLLYMKERLAELELALEDQGWQRILADGERELSRDALRRLCSLSRLMYLKNPLINRAVLLQASYVFGQGLNIQSDDESTNQLLQDFMDDYANKAELTSHQARMLKEVDLNTLGNIFFVLFSDPQMNVKVRTITVDEVHDIICNPEDAKEPWYYHRVWTQRDFDVTSGLALGKAMEAYYPDWRYKPTTKPPTINGKPVQWASPVYHVKVGGMAGMRFGVPETYAALDWARAYKEFLEDVASQMRALSRFAWSLTTTGGTKGVQAAKTKLNTTLGIGNNSGFDTNPPPIAGSTFVATDANKLAPINTANAAVKAEDGRRFLLMVCAATGFPESFFGDVSVGTLATARSLDRPTELKMRDRQTLWTDVHRDILTYVLEKKGIDAKAVKLDIDFPALLEHDVEKSVAAIAQAATLGGFGLAGTMSLEQTAREMWKALGVDDVDELLAQIDFEAMREQPEEDPAQPDPDADPNADPNAAPATPPAPLDPTRPVSVTPHNRRLPQRKTAEAMMVEAVRELRQAIAGGAGK